LLWSEPRTIKLSSIKVTVSVVASPNNKNIKVNKNLTQAQNTVSLSSYHHYLFAQNEHKKRLENKHMHSRVKRTSSTSICPEHQQTQYPK